MVRESHTSEQIINLLREDEVLLSQGTTIGEASQKTGITESTCYRWRREYGGMRVDQTGRQAGESQKSRTDLEKGRLEGACF